MEPGAFCEYMGFPQKTAVQLEPVWEIAHCLAEGKARFFEFEEMLHYCRVGKLNEEIIAELVRVEQEVHRDPALRLYAEAALYGLMSQKVPVGQLPYPEKVMGDGTVVTEAAS